MAQINVAVKPKKSRKGQGKHLRQPNFIEDECKKLVGQVIQNYDGLFGNLSQKKTKQDVEKIWKEITNDINA